MKSKRGGQPFTVCYHTNPMTFVYILLAAVLCVSGYIAWKLTSSSTEDADPRLKAELDRRMEEIGELKGQVSTIKSEKQELEVKGKELSKTYLKLESEMNALRKERDALASRVTKYEASDEQRQKEQKDMTNELASTRKALEDERVRIRREDEERMQYAEEERDRMWANHENDVVSALYELCKKPQFAFSAYDNTKLPSGFDGSLKPDFLIDFLEQFVIFDAKVSRSQDLQTYIKDAVKKTAKKVKGNKDIYPTIFLVVPTEAISSLKQRSFYEEGFTFYAVSPEALEPILASLKRIETYEFAQEMDPQERENIVDILAHFDFHISTRNAVDYQLLQHGLETLAKIRGQDSDFLREVLIKSQKIRNLNLNTSEVKQMTNNPEALHQKLLEITQPTAKMAKEDVKRFS